jgi:hypothetical protein
VEAGSHRAAELIAPSVPDLIQAKLRRDAEYRLGSDWQRDMQFANFTESVLELALLATDRENVERGRRAVNECEAVGAMERFH